ncbi:threonine-phosphate decarboxylase CobD [Desulfoscipio gibsoniae]|uniref:threonine-phosphate decarboxylase n=1 Tax=Desulfoscipio gibsoniae DSM 7213 TaxID=767817 RepID=R4KFH3_9FIRM|nr:threonine-phosphate decarboxylase CobD [Desulfoscipio gibsoniae]AGL01344.1 L-threonine-O-3-phosphate decarboxylase [Desulfoscipio gibsoniae DSM 7213]
MIHTEYRHGGDVFGAARSMRCNPREIYDFSANINPLGTSPMALAAIADNLDLIRHYPDPRCAELRAALAGYLNVAPEKMVLGNGAAELIYLLARVMNFRRAVVTAPTFVEYGAAITNAGGALFEVPLLEEEGFTLPVPRIKKALCGADVVYICNPNNPTGGAVKRPIIQSVIEYARSHDAAVVVDEAFVDFLHHQEQYTVLPLLGDYPNLIVLYSLTKFFGIPGLRLGVLMADDQIIKSIEAAKDPWNVNSLAQIAGTAALADDEYMAQTRELIWRERDFLHRAVSLIPGLKTFAGEANYLLVKIQDSVISSTQLAAQTARHGVLVRDCASFSGLGNKYIRVAVKTRAENAILLNVLREIMKGAANG